MARFRSIVLCAAFLVFATTAVGDEPDDPEDKLLSGMSIVGNDEAPKSLVIVPWKSSALGDTLNVSRALDDGRNPVDRDVFDRELDYYEIWAHSSEKSSSAAQ